MQLLALLSVVPLVGFVIMGVLFTRETWIGGNAWKDSDD